MKTTKIRKRVQLKCTDPSLTETEHADSCDINKMIKKVLKGQQVRGGAPAIYGHDDLTMDGLSHRIMKAQTEEELQSIAQTHEFTQQELDLIPKSLQEKFKFKVRKPEAPKPAPKNDDQTTKNEPPKPPQQPEPQKT